VSIEEDIRAAMSRAADRSTGADAVRSTLGRQIQRARQRRRILAVTGAAAGIAATGGVPLLLADRRRHPQPAARPRPVGIPLWYKVGWVPDGMYFAGTRIGLPGGGDPGFQVLQWRLTDISKTPDTDPIWLMLTVGGPTRFDIAPGAHPVEVNGRPGVAHEGNGGSYVRWTDTAGRTLEVDADAALSYTERVARSVAPDGYTALEPALTFGWLPSMVTGSASVDRLINAHGNASDVTEMGTYDNVSYQPSRVRRVDLDPRQPYVSVSHQKFQSPPDPPTATTSRPVGEPGRITWRKPHAEAYAEVYLDDGTTITIDVSIPGVTEADVRRIAAGLRYAG
jgi:hypothetical protein